LALGTLYSLCSSALSKIVHLLIEIERDRFGKTVELNRLEAYNADPQRAQLKTANFEVRL
jgi:hypothetical protein